MSIDPAAQLRHELRTPLNHIIGYTELLLEELADGDKPELTAGLAELRTDARQLLTLLNEVLARGHAGPPDLAAARSTLGPPLERVRAAGEALRQRAVQADASALLPDLDRIRLASDRLGTLLRPGSAPGQEAVRQGAALDSGAGQPGERRDVILVVDDNEDNRDMLARRLRRQGHEVLTAAGGRPALETLTGTPVDLVLLDVMMPDLDGYAVLQRLKGDPTLRDIPVLMISALDELDSGVSSSAPRITSASPSIRSCCRPGSAPASRRSACTTRRHAIGASWPSGTRRWSGAWPSRLLSSIAWVGSNASSPPSSRS